MIVYNITYKVRWNIADKWQAWQQSEHTAAHMATGLFEDYRWFRLLDQDEDEGPTFVIQYLTSSLDSYEQFVIEFAPGLQRAAWDRWGDGFIAFRTLMETVDQ